MAKQKKKSTSQNPIETPAAAPAPSLKESQSKKRAKKEAVREEEPEEQQYIGMEDEDLVPAPSKKLNVGMVTTSTTNNNSVAASERTVFDAFVEAGIPEADARKYEAVFIENDVTEDMFEDLTYDLLRQLDVKVGHQMKIMKIASGKSGRLAITSSSSSYSRRKAPVQDEEMEDSQDALPVASQPKKVSKGKKEKVDSQEIRRIVRSAFKKKTVAPTGFGFGGLGAQQSTPDKYSIEIESIREEIKKGKDCMLAQGDNATAFTYFEAITDEYVNVGTEIGEKNIDRYPELLTDIAQGWVDVLLSRNCKLDAGGRSILENKLVTWDKSPDPEHGTFTDARWACKHGWHDVQLNNVMAGEHIGKFYEPVGLLISRLNTLEREDDAQSALNLANAVDLFNYSAKFLIKLGKLKEAESTALKLKDPSAAFSIAQLARPLDAKIAFNISMHSLIMSETWNNESVERAAWLSELAVSQKMLDNLVKNGSKKIKNKTIQFELSKVLRRLEQLTSALEFAKLTIKPYSAEQIQQMKEEKEKEKEVKPTDTNAIKILHEQVEAAAKVPRALSKWLWELAYDMEQAAQLTRDKLDETLNLILDNVEEVSQLIEIAQDMSSKAEYALILDVGTKCLQLLDKQLTASIDAKREFITRQQQIKLLKAEQEQLHSKKKQLPKDKEKELNDLILLQQNNPISPNYDVSFDNTKLQVCRIMIQSALDSKVSPVLEKILPKETIDGVIDTVLDSVKDVNHIVQLAEEMRARTEYNYILRFGQRAQERVQQLIKEYKKREQLSDTLFGLRNEQNELKQKRLELDATKLKKLQNLELEEALFAVLPPYATTPNTDNWNFSAAKLMVTASLDIKAKQLLEIIKDPSLGTEAELEEELWKVIEGCLKYVKSPNHMMQLAGILKDREAYQMVLKVDDKVIVRINELQHRYMERQKIIQHLNVMKEESGFLAGINKTLDKEQQDLLNELEEKVKKLPKSAGYDPQNMDEYDRLLLQVAQQMVGAVYDSKQKLENKIARDFEMSEKQIATARKHKRREFEQVVKDALQKGDDKVALQSPSLMLNLAQTIYNWGEHTMVLKVGGIAFDIIKEIVGQHDAQQAFKNELQALREEKNKLAIHRKLLSADQQARLRELELEDKINGRNSSYLFSAPSQCDRLILDFSQLMTKSILDAKDQYLQKIENDVEHLISEEQREAEKSNIDINVENTVANCLNYLEDPNHFFNVAKSISDRSRKEVSIVFRFGEATQQKIQEINSLRKERAPLQLKIDQLQSEIENLERIKKQVPTEMQDDLTELKEAIEKLPAYPHFSDLQDYHEYDNLNVRVVQVLIGVALDYRVSLDRDLKIYIEQPEKIEHLMSERESITAQIEDIIDLALQNVKDPESLQKFESDIRSRRESQYVIKVAKEAINQIRILEEQRAVRAPLEKLLDALKKEQEQLALQKKKLAPEQEREMKDLEKQISKLPEWPHYAALHNYQQYNGLILSVVRDMVLVVLDKKQTLEDKVKRMKETQDPNYNEEEIEQERAEIASELKEVADFAVANVQNPESLSTIENDLANRSEVAYSLEVAKRATNLISRLEDMRQVRAPIQEQIDKLRKEEQALKEKRKQLSPEQQLQLSQLEDKLKKLPKWPYFASVFNFHQYDNLNLTVVTAPFKSALDVKSSILAREQQLKMQDAYEMNEEEITAQKQEVEDQLKEAMALALETLRNPQHLYSIAATLKSRSELNLAIQAVERMLVLTKQIDDMRAVRAPIQEEINKLREEEEELVSQKKTLSSFQLKQLSDLEKKLAQLPAWPYFAALLSYHQYDRLNLDGSQLIISSLLDERDNIEEQFREQMMEDPSSVNHEAFEKRRKDNRRKTNHSVKSCLKYVHDPNLLLIYAKDVRFRASSIVLQVAPKGAEQIDTVEQSRQARDKLRTHIQLFKEEKEHLENQKKQLAPELQRKLESLEQELNSLRVPDYVSTANQHDTLQYEFAQMVLESVWQNKARLEQRIAEEENLSEDKIKQFKDIIEKEVNASMELFENKLYNPHNQLRIANQLHSRSDFELVVKLGTKSQELLVLLEQARKQREQPQKQLQKLREDKELLENQRKQLPPQQQEELRELELEERLLALMPSYVFANASSYDDAHYDVALEMSNSVLDRRTEYENKIAMNEELQESDIQAEREAIKNELSAVVTASLGYLKNVNNFLRFARDMTNRKEYTLVIQIGEACEARIDELRKELEERELLQIKQKELEDKTMLQKDGPTKDQQRQMDEIKAALEALPVEYDDKQTLDEYTLQITGLVVPAAKIENNDEVLRVQTSLAFKVESTPDRWNQVKMLTSEDDWEEVKKELVVYLLKASTNPEEKGYIDPAIKVDLLLAEGLWSECLEIFPKPTDKEGELELLYKLWMECEKNNHNELEKLKPTVERYVKRYFSEFKYQELDKVIDQVQRRFPSFVFDLFQRGAEMMMVTIMPSQYAQFVQFLRTYQKRLVNVLALKSNWDHWLELFKMAHKGKKKLIGLVNIMGDSAFNVLPDKPKKGKKH